MISAKNSTSSDAATRSAACQVAALLSALLTAVVGCDSPPEADARIVAADSSRIEGDVSRDDQIANLVAPYREELEASMGETLGTAAETISKGRPESALGNLVSDALLWYAREQFGPEVDLAVLNHGGIRLPAIPAGPIEVADIYQLVPFDNRVVVLELKGAQILELLKRLSENGGEPMAGIRYVFSPERKSVSEIRIGSHWIDQDKTYLVATVDYLASIGGEFEILGQGSNRREDPAFLRDAVIQYVRQLQTVRPILDQRVIHESGKKQ